MWSVASLCRTAPSLRAVPSKLLVPATKSGLGLSNAASRELITLAKNQNPQNGFKLLNLVRWKGLPARLSSTAPKPAAQPPRMVGYWLLGCSGMVFTAVVLGMLSGYLILVYCVYYVVNMVVKTNDGSK